MTKYEFRYLPIRGHLFPIIPLELKYLGSRVATYALVDSGATLSLLDEFIARTIGVRTKSGKRIKPVGIGGSIVAYVHTITLKIGEEEFDAEVAFAYGRRLPVNLLGRSGVFERFLVTFDEKNHRTILESVENV